MSPRPASAPADTTTSLDDFDWPPKTDGLTVHEIAAEAWQLAPTKRAAPEPVAVSVTVTLDADRAVVDPNGVEPHGAEPPAVDPAEAARPPLWRRDR